MQTGMNWAFELVPPGCVQENRPCRHSSWEGQKAPDPPGQKTVKSKEVNICKVVNIFKVINICKG